MPELDEKSTDELKKLSYEISLLREQIASVGGSLARIEKRLKLVFPDYQRVIRTTRGQLSSSESSKSREELMVMYDSLLTSVRSGGDSAYAARIQEISAEDLVALAFELGVSDRRKIGINKAREGIRRRVQESLLLGATSSASKNTVG